MNSITTVCSDSDPIPPLDVAAVFAQIKEHNRKACDGIRHMVKAGELLTMLKKKLPHGQFIKMAVKGTGLSRSTISRYMQIAANGARVGHLTSGRDAIDLITKLNAPAPPPAPRPSPATVIIEAEIVEPSPAPSPSPQDDEPEPLVVDGTKHHNDPVDPTEPLLVAIKEGMPDATPEPIFHAIERLIFALIRTNSPPDYIHALADAVLTLEGGAKS